jgi:hypothetical protein
MMVQLIHLRFLPASRYRVGSADKKSLIGEVDGLFNK